VNTRIYQTYLAAWRLDRAGGRDSESKVKEKGPSLSSKGKKVLGGGRKVGGRGEGRTRFGKKKRGVSTRETSLRTEKKIFNRPGRKKKKEEGSKGEKKTTRV